MRRLIVSAAVIGLVAGFPPAFAQDREHHDRASQPQNEQHGEQHSGQTRGGEQPHGGPQPGPAIQTAPEHRETHGRERGPGNATRGPERRDNNNAMRGPEPGARDGRRVQPRDFSGVRNYHRNFRAERRFHAAPYVRPRGFYVRRWAWGETLPPLFWARPYWILDFEDYDLPPPPFGAVWVRVGDDALLIDQYSGMIIEVDYGIFY